MGWCSAGLCSGHEPVGAHAAGTMSLCPQMLLFGQWSCASLGQLALGTSLCPHPLGQGREGVQGCRHLSGLTLASCAQLPEVTMNMGLPWLLSLAYCAASMSLFT